MGQPIYINLHCNPVHHPPSLPSWSFSFNYKIQYVEVKVEKKIAGNTINVINSTSNWRWMLKDEGTYGHPATLYPKICAFWRPVHQKTASNVKLFNIPFMVGWSSRDERTDHARHQYQRRRRGSCGTTWLGFFELEIRQSRCCRVGFFFLLEFINESNTERSPSRSNGKGGAIAQRRISST